RNLPARTVIPSLRANVPASGSKTQPPRTTTVSSACCAAAGGGEIAATATSRAAAQGFQDAPARSNAPVHREGRPAVECGTALRTTWGDRPPVATPRGPPYIGAPSR